MPDYLIHLTPITVAPAVVFVLITTLNIIGNVLKALSYNNITSGIQEVWISLWQSYVCSTSGSCVLYDHRDLDLLVGTSEQCTSFIAHYRATGAFGIISSFFAGVLVIASILLVIQQQVITFRKVARYGLIMSIGLLVVELIEFVLFITLKDRSCITAIANPSLEPAPFMYLGGMIFSMVNCGLYLRIGHVYKARATTTVGAASPQAPRFLPAAATPQQQHQTSVVMQPVERSLNASRVVVEQRPVSPIRVRSPVRVRSPISSGDGLWPDGDDWQLDEPSGLLWSEVKHLFFDRSSGQFYDPKSDQWYDPEGDRWYKLTK